MNGIARNAFVTCNKSEEGETSEQGFCRTTRKGAAHERNPTRDQAVDHGNAPTPGAAGGRQGRGLGSAAPACPEAQAAEALEGAPLPKPGLVGGGPRGLGVQPG